RKSTWPRIIFAAFLKAVLKETAFGFLLLARHCSLRLFPWAGVTAPELFGPLSQRVRPPFETLAKGVPAPSCCSTLGGEFLLEIVHVVPRRHEGGASPASDLEHSVLVRRVFHHRLP